MNNISLLDGYYSWLLALERRAPLTVDTYRIEIRKYLEWLEKEEIPMGKLSDLSRYLAYRQNVDGLDSRSIAKAISALRSFYRFLENEGYDDNTGFVKMLERPRSYDRLPEVHKREDVDRLLAKIPTDTLPGIRNRALYELIYSSGLRISEAVSMDLTDLFLDKNLARVKGKGDKERLVIFGAEASFWLKNYLKNARQKILGHKLCNALFINKYGKRLSRKGIWKNYRKLAIEASMGTKLHTLRHTFATELLAGGADLRSVQELLGHSDITTTQIYTHIDQSHLRDSHKRYLPNLKNWSTAND